MPRSRIKAVIIGPTPPPYHGMSVFTAQILAAPELRAAYELVHLETADRRSTENMGRFELTNVVLGLRHSAELVWIMIRHRPEIVYVEVAQNEWAYLRDALFIGLGKLFGGRIVTHLHGSELRAFYERTNPFVRAVIRWSSRLIDAAAVLGDGLREVYTGLVPDDRVHTVPNGVPDPFAAGTAERGSAESSNAAPAATALQSAIDEPATDEAVPGLSAIYIGTLERKKGVHTLLEAIARLGPAGESVRWSFAGEWRSDEERAEAETIIARHGLEEKVIFLGQISGPDKRRLFQEADLLVFPSVQREGMPLVILEAMAAELPVVSTETGAVRDTVINGETGWVVPQRDVDALASAIQRLIENPKEREEMGRAGRKLYEAEYTEKACAERLVQLFDTTRGVKVTSREANRVD